MSKVKFNVKQSKEILSKLNLFMIWMALQQLYGVTPNLHLFLLVSMTLVFAQSATKPVGLEKTYHRSARSWKKSSTAQFGVTWKGTNLIMIHGIGFDNRCP